MHSIRIPLTMRAGAVAAGLCGLSAGLTLILGPEPLGPVLFTVPVALCVVLGRHSWAVLLVGCAALAGVVGIVGQAALVWLARELTPADRSASGGPEGRDFLALAAFSAALYAAVAALGLVAGAGIRRRWTYGRIVAVVTALAFALLVFGAVASWERWTAMGQASLEGWLARLAEQAKDPGNQRAAASLELFTFLHEHVGDTFLGIFFWPVFAAACIMVSAASWALCRYFEVDGVPGGFVAMRPPDWLVWTVILCAGLWYADQRFDLPLVRAICWNGAIALAAIYYANGIGVLVHAISVLRPHVILFAAGLAALVLLGLHPPLLMFGLFDTWADFRVKASRFAELRRQSQEQDNNKDG